MVAGARPVPSPGPREAGEEETHVPTPLDPGAPIFRNAPATSKNDATVSA